MRNLLAAFAASAVVFAAAPAFAGEREEQVTMCASALDVQGLAKAGDYRAKFVKAKGGAAQTVTIKLIPNADGPSITGECLIKKGEVTSATIQS